jgi:pSer/pThr/pTyr-binding forkhead associated (FHA) protein
VTGEPPQISVADAVADLKAVNEAERRGLPFLTVRMPDGRQRLHELPDGAARLTVGRREESDVALPWDDEVSRLHALLEHVGDDWIVVDDGLSRNGSFLDGARVLGRRRLGDGSRLCFGETVVVFRDPGDSLSTPTASLPAGATTIPLTPTQHKVIVELCRPVNESAFATPATNKDIAEAVFLSVDAVKAHLRVLFERFGLEELPQNQKRGRLAALALVNGLVTPRDF